MPVNDTTEGATNMNNASVANFLIFVASVVTIFTSITDKKVMHTFWPVTTAADLLFRALVAFELTNACLETGNLSLVRRAAQAVELMFQLVELASDVVDGKF
jgi:hypothetical protein